MTFRCILALCLLASTALLAQDPKHTTRKTAKPLAGAATNRFTLPWQRTPTRPRAAPGARARTSAETLQAFGTSEKSKLDERERRVAAEVARIRQAGGLQAYWKSQLALAQKQSASGPPGARTEKLTAQARTRLESFATCMTATLFGIWDGGSGDPYVTPRSSMLIQGCRLGTSPGKITLTAKTTGLRFVVTPTYWSEDSIWASIDLVTGIQDLTAVLQVTTATGAVSNTVDVSVIALRGTAILASRPNSFSLTAECGDNSDYDNCASLFKDPGFTIVDHSLGGIHWSRCCFNGVSGTDRYFVSLKNGWKVWIVSQLSDWSFTTCSADWGNDRGHVDQPTGYTPLTASTEIDVNWWVDANCSEAWYFFDVYAIGPSGVPFE
jgi:hypothetical protein